MWTFIKDLFSNFKPAGTLSYSTQLPSLLTINNLPYPFSPLKLNSSNVYEVILPHFSAEAKAEILLLGLDIHVHRPQNNNYPILHFAAPTGTHVYLHLLEEEAYIYTSSREEPVYIISLFPIQVTPAGINSNKLTVDAYMFRTELAPDFTCVHQLTEKQKSYALFAAAINKALGYDQ